MDYKLELKTYLSTCSGKVLNVFYEIYQIIKATEKELQPEAVMYFIDILNSTDSDESHRVTKEYYTDAQLDKIREKFQKKNIQKLIYDEATDSSKNNVQPIEFYRKIWNKLCSYCRNDKETAYVLFVLVDHDLIPYRNVGIGISMSDEDYAAGAKKIRTTIFKDTMYIFSLRYEEKTQQASLLLDQLLSLEDKNLQTIYMSMIIQLVERNIKDRLKDCIDEA